MGGQWLEHWVCRQHYRHDFGFTTSVYLPSGTYKHRETMRSVILTGCLWVLAAAACAQEYSRVPSGPVKWGQNSSIEIMPGNLATYYGTNDTASAHRRGRTGYTTAVGGNPTATRFASVRTQCDDNAMVLQWTAVQQFGADTYEVQQSADGRNWTVVGVVPANRTEFGESNYRFDYRKEGRDAFYRILATSIGGDRVVSPVLESPCSNTAYLALTPNPVYSTTTVRIGSPTTAKVKMVLLDAKGAVVMSRDASLVAGTNHLPLDMSRVQRGYYTLVIRWLNGKQETLGLVKK
jgi:hypothetical protein